MTFRSSCSLLLLLCLSFSFTGCSGGASGGTIPGPGPTATPTAPPLGTPSSVSGVAATGRPLAAVTVTLKDTRGVAKTGTTGADGSYSIDTTGMTGPFIVLATTSSGTKLYSVSADANAKTTVNITPFTDVLARSWYDVQSGNIDTSFASSTPSPPSPTAVSSINGVIGAVAQPRPDSVWSRPRLAQTAPALIWC